MESGTIVFIKVLKLLTGKEVAPFISITRKVYKKGTRFANNFRCPENSRFYGDLCP